MRIRATGLRAAIAAAGTVILALTLLVSCHSNEGDQVASTRAMAVPGEILGWQPADSVEAYDRESIFKYINGAGEVYRSYAFADAMVWRFTKPDAPEITVDIFDMSSPQDAYGVFSYTRESEQSGIGSGYEQRGSVLCFWQNRYYVCVAASESTNETAQAVMMLARRIAEQLPKEGDPPRLVQLLPEAGMVEHSRRFFHIQPSLNYHYYLSEENILKLDDRTNAVMATYSPGSTYLLCVEYPSPKGADQAYDSFITNYLHEGAETGLAMTDVDKWTGALKTGKYLIVALDAVSELGAKQLLADMTKGLIEANLITESNR